MLSEISTLNVQVCNMLNKKIIKLRDGNQLNWINTWTISEKHLNIIIRYVIKEIGKYIV